MRPLIFIATLSYAAGLVAAVDYFPPPPTNTTFFYFKTSVHPGQPAWKDIFNNKYLAQLHTGAGLGDVGFFDNVPRLSQKGWFELDKLHWFPPTTKHHGYSQLSLGSASDTWAEWAPMHNNFYPDWNPNAMGFTLQDHKLEFRQKGALIAGWLVCDWNHSALQLFWLTSEFWHERSIIPSSCARVDLVAEVAPISPDQVFSG